MVSLFLFVDEALTNKLLCKASTVISNQKHKHITLKPCFNDSFQKIMHLYEHLLKSQRLPS